MKKLTILMILTVFSSGLAYGSQFGSYDAGIINSQYLKEFKLFEKDKKVPEILDKKPETFLLNAVNFENNNSCTSDELTQLVNDKIGQDITPADISDMRKTITQYYQSKGFASVVVTTSLNEITDGNVLFNIEEGPQNSIEVEFE